MAEGTAKIRELAGWTLQEIQLLIKDKECPGHWHSNSKATFALVEVIRDAIESSNTSYRQTFPLIFDCLGLKQPSILTGVLAKVKRYVAKADKTGDYLPLCQEIPELSTTLIKVIGPACAAHGITPEWLGNADTCSRTLTNHVVIELHHFRARNGITWKTVHDMWWTKLFPNTVTPPRGTIQTNWESLAAKKKRVSRDLDKDKRESFLIANYELPQPRAPTDVNDYNDYELDDHEEQVSQNEDSGYNTMTDRCIVNKKFVQLMQEWREQTLPKVTANWESLSDETKANMTTINDLYCGKHLVLNMQDYAGAALKEWEQVESTTGKLGREKHLPWSRKESATFLAIRTVCEAFGPDASAQAGSPKEFIDHLEQI
ncbi:uncharacterized protein LOC117293722 [Asterias rubens]|uniref:uncharacterized protein LOC117293722 n=1 Tax=Asterias rubens TaxID=7604 RepID=UPI001455906A|nr:uncharacterized protein LOC117293722 [Asterias rubens]